MLIVVGRPSILERSRANHDDGLTGPSRVSTSWFDTPPLRQRERPCHTT
jgi:hypothetical protein